MSRSIHQEIVIAASPARVYQALTDAAQFSAFTAGAPADISREQGAAFSCFGGMITGRQVELVPDRRIVQAWRAGSWPEGVYSIVTFELSPDGGGTRIALDQAGFPKDADQHLESGWHKMYWEPLKKYLG